MAPMKPAHSLSGPVQKAATQLLARMRGYLVGESMSSWGEMEAEERGEGITPSVSPLGLEQHRYHCVGHHIFHGHFRFPHS